MSFITQQDAETILGLDFAPDGDKARLVRLANVWVKNEVGYVPDEIADDLKDAACEIIKGILAGVIYAGVARETVSESVSPGSGVSVSETYREGSVEISQYEQIAKALIDSLDLKPKGFTFEVYRG